MDVDLERARLHIRQTIVADKGYQRVEAPKDYEHRVDPDSRRSSSFRSPAFAGRRPQDSGLPRREDAHGRLRNHAFRNGWFDPPRRRSGSGASPRTSSGTPPRASRCRRART